jgi:NAD(P)-dependent dehydrogenase (short-subunit alcohol dehydrogenase family)
MELNDTIDAAMEALVVPSFTSVGSAVRSRLDDWQPLDRYDLSDRVVLLTGATSGLGLAAAHQLAACGATLILSGRNPEKLESTRASVARSSGNEDLHLAVADMGDLDQVATMADGVLADHDRLDAVLHNAGALSAERTETAAGLETTVASQVVGPFLLTARLLDRLARSDEGRVITMSSGGMYTATLEVDDLQMGPSAYGGSEQYARAKRAQVTLNEMWADRHGEHVRFHALHPGWADTPGVEASLPTFRRIVGPLLRSPDDGADTMVWLTADDGEPLATNGRFWLDRRVRSIHKINRTRRSDTPARRGALWDWCTEHAGVDL